jgi:hypothetical protein
MTEIKIRRWEARMTRNAGRRPIETDRLRGRPGHNADKAGTVSG